MINKTLLPSKAIARNYVVPTSNVVANTKYIEDIIVTNITLEEDANVLIMISSAFYSTAADFWLQGYIRVDNDQNNYYRIIECNKMNVKEMKSGFIVLNLSKGTHKLAFGINNTNGSYEVITIPAFSSCTILAIEL